MTQKELVKRVAARAEISAAFCDKVVDTLLDEIAGALCRGEEIRIPRFGLFRNREFSARTTRNPQTGRLVDVPARKNPEWRSAPDLKRRVNEAHGINGLPHAWSRG